MARQADMTKLTKRQKRHAGDVEKELRKTGMPRREAERKAWGPAADYPGRGKRNASHTYRGRAKIASSATAKSRKTHTPGS
jgi:hypothetical protein